jgi:hypothetical protein
VSILRLQSLYVISKSTDVTWDNPLAAIWSSTELNTGIICSCLPTLKGCLTRYFPKVFSTYGSGRHGTSNASRQQSGMGGHSKDGMGPYNDRIGGKARWSTHVQPVPIEHGYGDQAPFDSTEFVPRNHDHGTRFATHCYAGQRGDSDHGEVDEIPLTAAPSITKVV